MILVRFVERRVGGSTPKMIEFLQWKYLRLFRYQATSCHQLTNLTRRSQFCDRSNLTIVNLSVSNSRRSSKPHEFVDKFDYLGHLIMKYILLTLTDFCTIVGKLRQSYFHSGSVANSLSRYDYSP
jgi:hypothetical protein